LFAYIDETGYNSAFEDSLLERYLSPAEVAQYRGAVRQQEAISEAFNRRMYGDNWREKAAAASAQGADLRLPQCYGGLFKYIPFVRIPCQVTRVLDDANAVGRAEEAQILSQIQNIRSNLGTDIVVEFLSIATPSYGLRSAIDARYEQIKDNLKLSPTAHIVIFVMNDNHFLAVRATGIAKNRLLRFGLLSSKRFRDIQMSSLTDARAALQVYLNELDGRALDARPLSFGQLINNESDSVVASGVPNIVDDALSKTVMSEENLYRLSLLRPAMLVWLGFAKAIPNALIALIAYLLLGLALGSGVKFALKRYLKWPKFEKKLFGFLPIKISLGGVLGWIVGLIILAPLAGTAMTASLGRVEDIYEVFHLVGWQQPSTEELQTAGGFFVRLPPNAIVLLTFSLALCLPPLNDAVRWMPAVRLSEERQQQAADRMSILQLIVLLSPNYALSRQTALAYQVNDEKVRRTPFTHAVASSILHSIVIFIQSLLLISLVPAGLVLLAAINSLKSWTSGLAPAVKQAREISRHINMAEFMDRFRPGI
jgi:hypothetical protein